MTHAEHSYELSHGQRLLWAGQCLQPNEPLYNMAIVFRIRAALDSGCFQAAFARLVADTDAMRAVVVGDDAAPRQRFPAAGDVRLQLLDFSDTSSPQVRLREWAETRCRQPLDPRVCCYDSALVRLAEDDHAWYLNQHHLYVDAWSMAVLFRRLGECYAQTLAGETASSPAPPRFESWLQRRHGEHAAVALARATAYWRERLHTPPTPSRFYAPTPTTRGGRTTRLALDLGERRSARLRALADAPGYRALTAELARFRVFATVLAALLHRLGGQQRLVIGTPALNRPSPLLKDTAGLFIELYPLCVRVEEEDSFRTLFARLAGDSQALLLNSLPGACDQQQGRGFDVVLNFITATFGDFHGNPVSSDWVHSGYGDRNHLLRLQVQDFDRRGVFTLLFDVNEDCFDDDERDWLPAHFTRLLDAMLDDAEQRIARVALLDRTEQAAQIDSGRGARRVAPRATVSQRLREQAALHPDAVALAVGGPGKAPATGVSMSYRELDAAADRIGGRLNARGIGAGATVAIALPRGMDAVIAIHGVLRSGAAYLPLDPSHPGERIAWMLEDSGAHLLVAARPGAALRAARMPPIIELAELLSGPPPATAPPGPALGDLAYLLYTSGSTGRSKGVAVAHDSLANYIGWAARQYCEGEARAFPLFTPLTFDLTVTSLFVPVSVGATLVVYEEPAGSREIGVRRVVQDNRVEVIKLTPAHLALMQDMDLSASRLRVLVVGGEDFKSALAQSVQRRLGGRAAIYNEYGPTEATVACMIHRYRPGCDDSGSVPIGTAIDNLDIYLLDSAGNALPRGTVGEIVIGGTGVARGYLGTLRDRGGSGAASRFVANPFRAGERMYRSGDRGYRDRDGVVHYLGRTDTQLKVRGVRIEAAEVEAALLAHPDIAECVVDRLGAPEPAGAGFCRLCGLDGRHPEADIDAQGVCRPCRGFADARSPARAYFGDDTELAGTVQRIRDTAATPPHCLMLLSGGKDSTYALCRIVEMGLTPLVFTLDNGYISDGAKANIRRVVDKLGLELVVGSTPAMKLIFKDSLERFSNVCNGCFKTIYTLSMKLARERGIRHIVTGLSRGQIFETRMAGLFGQAITDRAGIDDAIIEARKAYHRMDDAVSRCLDVSLFDDDAVFEQIEFVDFYRYCDASLDDILAYLAREAAWIRPADTGRSTNCLINEVGIHVHKTERGYHNYALPYSWDVRLGHKQRDAARHELDDHIDLQRVQRILDELDYRPLKRAHDAGERLAAWFVSVRPASADALKSWLAGRLPAEFLPSAYVAMDALPLTANGKVDRAALPPPEREDATLATPYAAPASSTEQALAGIWADVLAVRTVGARDNFFDLGGDSILSLQIVARARDAGIRLTPQQVFDHPTVEGLAAAAGGNARAPAEQGTVHGRSPATPIQQRFLVEHDADPHRHGQVALLDLHGAPAGDEVHAALLSVWRHHDALGSRFVRDDDGRWWQHFGEQALAPELVEHRRRPAHEDRQLWDLAQSLVNTLDIGAGRLLRAALVRGGGTATQLLLVIHPLVVDGLSWWVLAEDLDALLAPTRGAALPAKTSSCKHWAETLALQADAPRVRAQLDYWLQSGGDAGTVSPNRRDGESTAGERRSLTVRVSPDATRRLLQDSGAALRASVPDLLATALLESSHRLGAGDLLGLCVEVHGREEFQGSVELSRSVGAFTCIYPVWLRRPPDGNPLATLRAVKEQLRAVPDRGLSHGLLRYLGDDHQAADKLAGQPPPAMLLSYMGNWDRHGVASAAGFNRPVQRLGAAGAGTPAVEVEAVVFGGVLEVRFEHASASIDGAHMQRFAECFRDTLTGYADDAIRETPAALAPSDFPNAGIAQDELDDILAEFGEQG